MYAAILGDPFVYWAFRIATLLSLLIAGYYITYRDEGGYKFWKYAITPIVVYSLNFGLRWDRLYDYEHYYQDLTGPLWDDYGDVLYLLWIDLFKFTGLPFWVAFIFYSAILIYGFLLIVKRFQETAVWSLPLFLIIPNNVDNFVRMYFAMAFLLIGISQLLDGKEKRYFFWALCAATTHFSAAFAIIVFYLLYKVICPRLNFQNGSSKKGLITVLLVYAVLYFFWDVAYFEPLAKMLGTLDVGDSYSHAQQYIDNADNWFTSGGNIDLKMGVNMGASNLLATIFREASILIVVIYGYKVLEYKQQMAPIYFATVLGIFIHIMAGRIELYSRFYTWLIIFEPIVVGSVFAYLPIKKTERNILLTIMIMTFYFLGFAVRIFDIQPLGYQFIWDR